MSPNQECEVCGTRARDIINTWEVPCLLSLDTPEPKCLRGIIETKARESREKQK